MITKIETGFASFDQHLWHQLKLLGTFARMAKKDCLFLIICRRNYIGTEIIFKKRYIELYLLDVLVEYNCLEKSLTVLCVCE